MNTSNQMGTTESTPPQSSTAIIPYMPPQQETKLPASSWLVDYVTALKNGRFHPFTMTERKARAATRNQSWGPTGAQLNELARLSFNPVDCSIIFAVIELRLAYPVNKWRNVYKGLSVLEFLLKRGSEDVIHRGKATPIMLRLESLESFAYITQDAKDVGDNVRHRARAIRALLQDDARLKAERAAHAKHMTSTSNSAVDQAPAATTSNEASQQQSSELPQAGETKGVTLEENKRHLAALKRLLARPENKLCADCGHPGAGQKPTWASINCGVFICMRCAGAHRSLGTHISQVRSCSLDTWLPEQVAFLAGCGGNTIANSYWEAQLPEGGKASATGASDLEAFVRRKYVDKAYALPQGVWPPEIPFEDDETRAILSEIFTEDEMKERDAAREAALLKDDGGLNQADTEQQNEDVKTVLPDLINLMDFDMEPTVTEAVEQQPSGVDTANIPLEDMDPLSALENLFAAAPIEMNGAYTTEVPSPHISSGYSPPWAPQPHMYMPGGLQYQQQQEAPAAFANGFATVPHQFTAGPILPQPPFPLTISNNSAANSNGLQQQQQQQQQYGYHHYQQQQPGMLQPHEQRAQQIMAGGLDSFVNHADLVAVKPHMVSPRQHHDASMQELKQSTPPRPERPPVIAPLEQASGNPFAF